MGLPKGLRLWAVWTYAQSPLPMDPTSPRPEGHVKLHQGTGPLLPRALPPAVLPSLMGGETEAEAGAKATQAPRNLSGCNNPGREGSALSHFQCVSVRVWPGTRAAVSVGHRMCICVGLGPTPAAEGEETSRHPPPRKCVFDTRSLGSEKQVSTGLAGLGPGRPQITFEVT